MKISFNPSNSNKNILDLIKNNKDIIFDLKGHSIFARGVEFKGTDTNTWRPVVDNLTSDSTTSSLSAKQGKVLKALIDGKSNSDHNHDGRYVYNYGGTQMNGASIDKNALGMTTTSGISGDWWHILQAAWNGEYRWNSQIAFPTQNRNGMYYRSGLDDNTKWGSWVKLLDVNNYSSTLDSRYYTESEVNSLLSRKLDRVNLTTGSWNPRGWNLAADYHYNGGDLSISENNGKMYVSVDGCFWQNEGRYRVLDTSDVADLKENLTVYQHLSSTDTTWYPLIWGGNSHSNTSNFTGAVYKSYDKLSWQTSSQTLYATRLQSEFLTTPVIRVIGTSDNMAWNRGSGRIVFVEDVSNSQAVSLVYTSYDSVRAPAGIRLTGSQGNEWFEASRLIKTGSNDNYVLLGAGGHILKGNANGNIPINNGTVNTNLNADLLDGYHASSFIKMKQFRFNQYKEGFWTKILTITINSTSDLQPVIAFNWIPSECAREVWAEFTINWRSNSPIFYAIWKGTAVRTLTCVNSSGNIWDVWVQGDKNSYDPFGEVQVTYAHNISSYNGGSLGYSDSDPGGTRCTLGGYVNYARSTGNADTVDGQHASAFSYKSWWHWHGKDGQPNWLWGGNNENDYYVYNPSNFRVAYAASAGNADTVDGEHASNFSYTHQSSFDFSKRKSGRIVTFDQWGTDYGWINGFASTHNNYLTSVLFNAHRTSNWYVGYMEGDMSTGETNGLQAVHKLAFADGDESYPIFLGYLNLYNGNDGTISSSFPCLGYSVPFTYTRGGAYCLINIPDTSFQTFYIKAAIASVHYSGAGMGYWVGNHRGDGAWWLHCDAVGSNAVQVKGFHLANENNDSWWGGNPLYSGFGAAKIITVCLFGYVKFR